MSNESPTTGLEVPPISPEIAADRRVQPRLPVSDPADSEVLFMFPDPDGQECAVPIHDVSFGGVSFRLTPAVLHVESGWGCTARLRFGERVIHGDMLVVRVSPNPQPGAICGAMFFANSPEGRRILRAVVGELA